MIAAAALLVQSCAERAPAPPSARMFSADMAGGAKSCTVPTVKPEPGQSAEVPMKVANDGGWCAVTVNNRGKPFDAGLLASPAGHGKVLIHTVGNDTRIDYTPAARFTGTDAFSVRLLPGDATVRVAVSVTPP